MTRILQTLPLVLALSAASAAAGEAPAPSGSKALAPGDTATATGVKMKSVDGKEVSIADVAGEKGTLVVFTCNECPYVKAWQGRMVRLMNAGPAKGIGAMAINSNDPRQSKGDSVDAMRKLAEGKGYEFPYVVDAGSKVARAFGAGRTPEVFLLDADGVVVYHGAIDDNSEDPEGVEKRYLADAIAALAAGEEVPVKETKSIGCTIKYPKA